MGIHIAPLYGKTDIGSAVEDIEKLVEKIKSNKFGKKDVIKLYEANAELIKAVLEDEIKD